MAITLLTGAGASKAFDYPTTVEFFSGLSAAENKTHQDILSHLRKQLGAKTLDVEDVLGVLQPIEDFVKTAPGQFLSRKLTDSWQQKIINFSKLCRDKCFDLYGVFPAESTVKETYLPILDACGWREHRLSLFTTNYDPISDVLMDIAEDENIPSYDGFRPRGRWEPMEYGKHITGLDIYRLHGSMSWVQRSGGIVNTRDYSLRTGKIEHLIIYPGYKGNPEQEDAEVYSLPHRALRNELKESSYFVVVGFAFRDGHINKILRDSMKANPKLKLVVINPEWPQGEGGVLNKLREKQSDRVHHIKCKFGDAELTGQLSSVLGKLK